MKHDSSELAQLIQQYQDLERQIDEKQAELSQLRGRIAVVAKRLGLADILSAGGAARTRRRRVDGSYVVAERESHRPVLVDGVPVVFRNRMTVLRGPKYADLVDRIEDLVLLDEATGEVVVQSLTLKV